MNTNFSRSLIAAAILLSFSTSALAESPQAENDEVSHNESYDLMTHTQALALAQEEIKVRAYVLTCVEQSDRQLFFLALSDRYRAFLSQYGRLSSAEVGAAPEPPKDATIDCSQRHEAVLQSIRDRDIAIQHLLFAPPPTEPPVVPPREPQTIQGSPA